MRRKKRADGRYQETFTHEGKRYTVYAKSAQDLTDKVNEKKQKLKDQRCAHDNPKLDAYYEVFTDLRRGKVRESTIYTQHQWYKNCADQKVGGIRLGDMRIRDIIPMDVQLVQQLLIKSEKGYHSNSINDYMKHLSYVFKTAVKRKIILDNPCDGIEYLQRRENEPLAKETKHRALQIIDTEAFLREAEQQGSFFLNCYKMMVQTGMRLGELAALSQTDIDDKFIHITKTVTKNELGARVVGYLAKTDCGRRIIPVTPVIKQIIKEQEAMKKKVGVLSTLVFCGLSGGVLADYTINRDMARICKAMNIAPVTSHALRDTFATRFIEQRPNDYMILKELMGHSDIKITLNLYAQVMTQNKINTMNELRISM